MSTDVYAAPIRTGELTAKAWNHFGAGYIRLTQVRAATGWADLNTADMMVMGEWPSTGNELHGFEIKVSRTDWLNEVRNPHKNDSVKGYCDRWWLVIADEAMVRPGELPENWGMMAWQGRNKKLKVVKQAPKLEAHPMDHCFVASLLRHNDKEMIPVDVHKDRLRDAARDAAAFEKKKNADLFEFVRTLAQGFGIKIKENKEYDYTKPGRPKLFTKWIAEIKQTYIGQLDAEKLAEMLRRADAYDSLVSDVEWMKKMLGYVMKDGDELRDSERAIVWANYALNNCNKFLAEPTHKSNGEVK